MCGVRASTEKQGFDFRAWRTVFWTDATVEQLHGRCSSVFSCWFKDGKFKFEEGSISEKEFLPRDKYF